MDEQGRLVEQAQTGDADALEQVLESVRDSVYRLSLRMVTRPADAEDATQEILIRVMTRLSTFRGEAAFTTWVHRVAVNYLLDRKRSAAERLEFTFDSFGEDLRTGLADPPASSEQELELLAQELRLSCTNAMLTCLDREQRVAYVLGEVFEVTSAQGAYICDVSEPTYRKRLSRARGRLRAFLQENCGLVNPERAECRCERRITPAVASGRVDPKRLAFAQHPAEQETAEMVTLYDEARLMRSHPAYLAPERLAERIGELIRSGRYGLLRE